MTRFLAQPPDLGRDIAWAVFRIIFPRLKPFGWQVHRQQIGSFRFWCSCPEALPRQVHQGLRKGLRQWSESFAGLVAGN